MIGRLFLVIVALWFALVLLFVRGAFDPIPGNPQPHVSYVCVPWDHRDCPGGAAPGDDAR